MDYMLEAVAFEEWFETHSLSISAQLLWHKLMYLNYKNGWNEWVQLDNKNLMKLIEVKNESTLIKIRKELIESGLIEYQMGRKGSPSRYKIKPISASEEKGESAAAIPEEQAQATSEINTACSSAGQVNTAAGLDVQKKVSETKPVLATQENIVDLSAGFEKFFKVYPRKKAKHLARTLYVDLIMHKVEGASEEKLLAAAENYAKECENSKEKFIKMPNNWLKDLLWVDYLPENYQEQEDPNREKEKIKNNRFNNIESRKYDYEELERALLGCT